MGSKKCKIAVFLKNSSSLLPGVDQTNQVCSNDDQGRVYQNLYFMTPGVGVLFQGRGHVSHIVKMHFSLKIIFSTPQALIRQTKYVVMMTKEGFTKIYIS